MQTALLSSLPDGTRVIYMSPQSSPVFQIRFCQRLSNKHGEAPIKTLPRDCWRYAAKGYPCSCGTISYVGCAPDRHTGPQYGHIYVGSAIPCGVRE